MRTTLCSAALLLASACSGNDPPKTTVPDVPADCQRPLSASALPGPQVLLRETHQVNDSVAFTVPAGTASITIVHQAKVANLEVVYKGRTVDNSAVPGVILLPDGGKAYDDNDPAFGPSPSPDGGSDPSGLYGFYGGGSASTAAFTIPNTAYALDAGVPAGTWRFTVNDYAYECAQPNSGCTDGGASGNSYDVMVLATPAPPAKPTLDLAFYLVADTSLVPNGRPLDATNAAADPAVRRMVKTFKGIFAAAGITVGNVNFYDVPAAARTRFGTHISSKATGPCDELDQMFTLSADHPGNLLNLFLVQSISSDNKGGGSVVGIDGTIPGPASLSGTVHSGAAVSLADLFAGSPYCVGTSDLRCGADVVAFIAAHEAGHFLGLFHTTESDGRDFDPITDTPKCPCLPCAASTDQQYCTVPSASHPYFLTATQCNKSAACAGGDNLMFWQLEQYTSSGVLSAQQAAIMALSPVVH